jgi:hypothetical protein
MIQLLKYEVYEMIFSTNQHHHIKRLVKLLPNHVQVIEGALTYLLKASLSND